MGISGLRAGLLLIAILVIARPSPAAKPTPGPTPPPAPPPSWHYLQKLAGPKKTLPALTLWATGLAVNGGRAAIGGRDANNHGAVDVFARKGQAWGWTVRLKRRR